jgi:hypothetical protein
MSVLQKESGFQGNALRISTGEKAFCTIYTDERFALAKPGTDCYTFSR